MVRSVLTSLALMAWGVAALVAGMAWSMVRPALRFISSVLILAAIIAMTIDATRWQTGGEGPLFLSLADHIRAVAPATLDGVGEAISRTLHPVLWNPTLTTVLALPAWLFLVLLSLAISYAARERRRIDIFIN